MRLVLYSKPGCHLCEGLQEKLEQVTALQFQLEVRDITTRDDWFQAYQYEIPVLYMAPQSAEVGAGIEAGTGAAMTALPRLSPRSSVRQLEQMLQRYWP